MKHDDPHFEDIVNELKEIQQKVDSLLFGSVFLRDPKSVSSSNNEKPESPNNLLNLEDTLKSINETIEVSNNLEDRLKEQLENKNNNAYEDLIEEYLRDLEDSSKILKTLKPILLPDNLRNGEPGKTDVSWLSWHRNTLGSKLHKEINDLQEIDSTDESKLETNLKLVNQLIRTADTLFQSAQYLSWFTKQVVNYNESLPEFERDFTVNLVSQWVQEEINKVFEHHKNCVNLRTEIQHKLESTE